MTVCLLVLRNTGAYYCYYYHYFLTWGFQKLQKERHAGETTNTGDQQPWTVVQKNWIKALHHRQTLEQKELSRSSPDYRARERTSILISCPRITISRERNRPMIILLLPRSPTIIVRMPLTLTLNGPSVSTATGRPDVYWSDELVRQHTLPFYIWRFCSSVSVSAILAI